MKVLIPAEMMPYFEAEADEGQRALLSFVPYEIGREVPAEGLDAPVAVVDNNWPTFAPVARQLSGLKLVQTLSAGVDYLAGIPTEGERRVLVSNARGAYGAVTAEWALTALLAVSRDIPTHVRDQDEGRWNRFGSESLIGKRVVVLGAGDLAAAFFKRATACEAVVSLVGRTARLDRQLGTPVHAQAELADLLPSADAVVLLVPLTSQTHHMVNADFLARLKDGCMVVNAARGPVVDTEALLRELQAGRLRAALDVTEPEPLPADHPLWRAPGCLITPHVGGGATQGSARQGYLVALACLAEFAQTGTTANLMKSEDLDFEGIRTTSVFDANGVS